MKLSLKQEWETSCNQFTPTSKMLLICSQTQNHAILTLGLAAGCKNQPGREDLWLRVEPLKTLVFGTFCQLTQQTPNVLSNQVVQDQKVQPLTEVLEFKVKLLETFKEMSQ